MGFVVRSFYVQAGDEEFPTGNSDSLRRSRSETLLSKYAQCLIDCNCGWVLDTTKNNTITSFTDIPCRTGNKTYPALFFINNISGCKLFMSFFGDQIFDFGIKNFSGNDLVLYKGSDYYGGFCTSMIPAGSSSTFGDPTTTTFIPSDATRICGTFYRSSAVSALEYPSAYNPINDYYYRYWIMATPYTICLYSNRYSVVPGFYTPIYMTGRIFGSLAHQEDNTLQAKYGTICFRRYTDTAEGWALVLYSTFSSNYGQSSINVPGFGINSSYFYSLDSCCCISKADGTWINGGDGSNRNVLFFTEGAEKLNSKIFDSNNKTRYCILGVGSFANDLNTYGVVAGDGFKGYLDTDLVIAGVASRKQTFDNGNYICLESSYNYLFGWNQQNEDIGD